MFLVLSKKKFAKCLIFSAWCLKNEGVSCVLLGASSVEQIKENIASLKVNDIFLTNPLSSISCFKFFKNFGLFRHKFENEGL